MPWTVGEPDEPTKVQQLLAWNQKLRLAQTRLDMAREDRRFAAMIERATSKQTEPPSPAEMEAEQDLGESIERAKAIIRDILKEEWVVRALALLAIGGAATFAAHYVFVETASSATSFVHEVTQMTHVLRSLTDLIRLASREASRWMAGSLGGAVGDAAGTWFSALFPQAPYATAFASVATRAAGTYAGFSFMHE